MRQPCQQCQQRVHPPALFGWQDGDQAAVLQGHPAHAAAAAAAEGGSLGGVSLDCHLHHTHGLFEPEQAN